MAPPTTAQNSSHSAKRRKKPRPLEADLVVALLFLRLANPKLRHGIYVKAAILSLDGGQNNQDAFSL
jgi:hypothetical protein